MGNNNNNNTVAECQGGADHPDGRGCKAQHPSSGRVRFKFIIVYSSDVDQYWSNADPDPQNLVNADPGQ